MAETKRVYEIRINGIQESYDGVKSLSEVLNGLSDVVVNVTKEEEKSLETRKSTASSTDALAKAQEKLNNYDRQYQEELAKVNAELSANKKEINDALKLQQAQDVVDAKQLDTYAQKQQYLSALNTLIRNHSTATEEDTQAIDRMVQESAALQAELKATDEQMKIYVRNVGNYQGAADTLIDSHKSIKQELKDLKGEMADMLANGVSKTDAAYLQLAERAGHLKDAISDANEDITNFASDTRGMTNAINLAQSAVGAYQLYNSTMELFGQGNEDAAESMKKMMAVMTVLNSLQQVQNSLLENGSATARLYNKAVELVQAALGIKKAAVEEDIAVTEASTVAEEANTVANELNATASETNAASTGTATTAEATNTTTTTSNTVAKEANTVATNKMSLAQKAGAVASNILSVALRAIPLMAVIGLVMALIQNWESIWNWFKKTFPVLDTLSKKFNKFGGFMKTVKAIAKGLGEGIINWLVNPFQTFAKVMGELLKGNFEAAWNAAKEGLSKQFTGFSESIQKELKGAAEDAAKDAAKVRMEKEHEVTEYQLQELEARYGNDVKYTKEGKKLMEKSFAERKALAKGNAEELKKIHLDELNYQRECQQQQTKATEAGAKARAAAVAKAAKEAKDAQAKAEKEAEEERKALEEQKKKNQKSIEDSQKAELDKWKSDIKTSEDELKKKITESSKYMLDAYIKVAEYRAKLSKLTADKEAKEQQKIRKEEELTIKKTEALAKAKTENIDDLSVKARAEISGIESEIEELAGEITDIDQMISYTQSSLSSATSSFERRLKQVDDSTARRILNTVQLLAQSAKEQKEKVETEIKDLENNLLETRQKLAKKEDETLRRQEQELQSRLENAKTRLSTMFGEYATKEIEVPVKIKVDDIIANYNELNKKLKANNQEMAFSMSSLMEFLVGLDEGFYGLATNAFYKSKLPEERLKNLNSLFGQFAQVLGLSDEKTKELWDDIEEISKKDVISPEDIQRLESYFATGELNIGKLGTVAKGAREDITALMNYTGDQMLKAYNTLISEQNKVISNNEKIVKNFREATKDFKLEPVMEQFQGIFKELARDLGLQSLNLKKTKERYATLKAAYKSYLEAITEGSEQMQAVEEAWQTKLEATKKMYGEDSMEYKLMLQEKESAMQAYKIEREKVSQQLADTENAEADLMKDWWNNLNENIGKIYSTLNENVFEPIANGLSDLFAFQLEEAQDALEETEKLLDKAVEAREQSADRMKEINDELRNDDGQNKEALQQRLAEEEVLLVQREEAERALQKEKEKREKEVQKKEAQQRVLELSQKLVEGIANTALGATAALKYGFPLGPVFAAIITAMGALQTAIISKQIAKAKSQMAHGGKIGEQGVSRSHRQGGHKIEGTNIEVEGQEWVINKKSSQKYDTLLRAINEDNLPLVRKQIEIIRERRIVNEPNKIAMFASGGQINTLAATSAIRENNEIAAITELIKAIDFQPTVAVTDINRVNRRLVRVQDLAGKAV